MKINTVRTRFVQCCLDIEFLSDVLVNSHIQEREGSFSKLQILGGQPSCEPVCFGEVWS